MYTDEELDDRSIDRPTERPTDCQVRPTTSEIKKWIKMPYHFGLLQVIIGNCLWLLRCWATAIVFDLLWFVLCIETSIIAICILANDRVNSEWIIRLDTMFNCKNSMDIFHRHIHILACVPRSMWLWMRFFIVSSKRMLAQTLAKASTNSMENGEYLHRIFSKRFLI